MGIQRHAVLIGIGKIGRRVLEALPNEWNICIIDKDINQLNQVPDKMGERAITKRCEDATSRLVLKETGLQNTSLVAIMTDSDEVNIEVARLVRTEFNVEEIFVVQNDQNSTFPIEKITILHAANILANRLANQMQGTLIASGVGLEEGEIRQVSVLNSSPARGQLLKNLKPIKWLVAAIYRENELIIPHGETVIKSGDDIVVVGDPETLVTEINFLRGGHILFPTQYGDSIGYFEGEQITETVATFQEKTLAESHEKLLFSEVNPKIHTPVETRKYLMDNEIGLVIMAPHKVSWFALWGFTRSQSMQLMFNSQVPFLVNRNNNKYKKILLAVRKKSSINVLSTVAMDIVRQFDASLTVLSVYPPNIDKKAYTEIESLPGEVEVLSRSHGITVTKQFREGNPIKQIREIAKDFDLLIIGFSKQERSTVGNPDISLHLFHKSPCSVLLVPWKTAGR